jgi:hypothetical protein
MSTVDDAMKELWDELDAQAKLDGLEEDDDDELIGWVLRQVNHIEADIEAIKKQADVRQRQLKARREALMHQYGERVREIIDKKVAEAKGNKRSVDTEWGRIGIRTVPGRESVKVDDLDKAIAAATSTCPQAIQMGIYKSTLREYIDETGEEIDGVHLERSPDREIIYAGDLHIADREIGQ